MVQELKNEYRRYYNGSPEAQLANCDSLLNLPRNRQNIALLARKAKLLLKVGKEQQSVDIYEHLIGRLDSGERKVVLPDMAIAYMRLGERNNCMLNHTGSSCIFPIKDDGIHKIKTGSRKAIETYLALLQKNPGDLDSRWLLNIAYMTLGEYPENVPAKFLLPGLGIDTGTKVKPFTDMAADLGLNINSESGGAIAEDFNNDGYIDIVTSGWELNEPMHYFQNNKDGTFNDVTEQSGLTGINGGLNIMQTDYDNDGNKDIFVLRGAWKNNGYGNQPSSLLHNNGDGTFTDVTAESGLLFFQPTQTAVWADFNNDGWLDVFVGAENTGEWDISGTHTCSLYINNHDGTFTNVTKSAHCDITGFVKGVTAADYNNDGWTDIFISTLNGKKYLLKIKAKAVQP